MPTSYRVINPILPPDYSPGVSALAFDPVSDTLWTGSMTGRVAAKHSVQGLHGVSFPVGGNLSVKKIVAEERCVRAFGDSGEGIGTWSKGGVNKWYFRTPNKTDKMTCFSSSSAAMHMLAASSLAPELVLLNSMTGVVVRQVPTPSVITHLEHSHTLLLSGSADGMLRGHDPRTALSRGGGSLTSVRAHQSGFQGLQTSSNYAFTIGLGERNSRPFPDPLVKIFDLRTFKPLAPVPFSSGAAFLQVLPNHPSTIAIASAQGLINVVDITRATSNEFHQLDVASYLTSAAVSPTSAYLAFGDAEGAIHILSQAEDEVTNFNGFDGHPIEWADPPAPLPNIEWSDSTPLNSIGLPHYDSKLLSSWTPQFLPQNLSYPPPPKIPSQVLSVMKTNDNVAYAALPRELKGRRNMVVVGQKKNNGRFRSGKSRAKSETEDEGTEADYSGNEVPSVYRHVEIEYSKFGVEDFDFGFYNKTKYSGLETHILNCYTNPAVQALHYITPLRRLAKSHITTNCLREHCLLCEMGFVSRMLEDAKGINCQSSNFCKTVGVLAQASNALELVDYGRESDTANLSHKIQSFHRFLVDNLISEGNSFPHNPHLLKDVPQLAGSAGLAAAPVTQLLGIDAKTIITCSSCKAVRQKDNMTHILDLTYPRRSVSNEPVSPTDFASILHGSLLRQIHHKATCQSCGQFTHFLSQRSIPSRDLPTILAVNACVYNDEAHRFWLDSRNQTFLKPTVELQGQVEDQENPDKVEYEVRAVVVQVSAKGSQSHLVAIVKVPDDGGEIGGWHVFNDFVVQRISEEEALSFPDKWKVPTIIYLERTDRIGKLKLDDLPQEIDTGILSRDTSISLNRDNTQIKHQPLSWDEMPKPGTLVAIDAEFVSMQQEETEFRSDGTNKVLRPARLSLARVSVLRGEGPRESVPFIDDHIHTSEVIVDYLTEFSGIKFGDLDPHLSRHTLTPLKLVYKKLRLLVDRGCIFIGHGLSKDFRIINIFVPKEQVYDTVDIYYLASRQRRLSLRFLTWFVLDQQIQTDTHDSIEDARSALNLYKMHLAYKNEGVWEKKLEQMYKEGRQFNFKPPVRETAADADQKGQAFNLARASNLLALTYSPSLNPVVPNYAQQKWRR